MEMTMEILDVVDENGNPTGETVERTVAHKTGVRHRTSHVWVVRKNNGSMEILLQKRSKNKDSHPWGVLTAQAQDIFRQEWILFRLQLENSRKSLELMLKKTSLCIVARPLEKEQMYFMEKHL